jgi:phenylalanyl-tRNA synthetase alpha subunit
MAQKKQAGSSSKAPSNSKKGSVIEPAAPAKSRHEGLQELSEKELDELYFSTFGAEPLEGLSPEEKIEQIESRLQDAPKALPKKATADQPKPSTKAEAKQAKKTVFTSKETGKKFELNGDHSGYVVVRQVQVQQLNNGMVEVPNTESIQTYYPEQFDALIDSNFFSESKMKIEVLQSA